MGPGIPEKHRTTGLGRTRATFSCSEGLLEDFEEDCSRVVPSVNELCGFLFFFLPVTEKNVEIHRC